MNWLTKLTSLPYELEIMPHPQEVRPLIRKPDELKLRPYEGAERIGWHMPKEIAEKEEEKYPNMIPLGYGRFGIVYDLQDGRVMKYTMLEDEVYAADALIKHPIPCVVKVFEVREVMKPGSEFIWAILMEKVQSLSSGEKLFIDALWRDQHWTYGENPLPKWKEELYPERFYGMFLLYREFLQCMYENKLDVGDAFSDNIGWNKENRLVLLDIGFI